MSRKSHVLAFVFVTLWINASEVFRYFSFVMPATREYLSTVPNVAAMNWPIFSVWGVWDTILTVVVMVVYWFVSRRYGHSVRTVVIAGVLCWTHFFVLFWMGMVNMGLASVRLAAIALPLALVEMLAAAGIAAAAYRRFEVTTTSD